MRPVEHCAASALVVGLVGITACDSTGPTPAADAHFTLAVAGAVDTTASGGPGVWTDLANAGETPREHRLVLWGEGDEPVPFISFYLLRGTEAPAVAVGAVYRRADEVATMDASLALKCPPRSSGSAVCTDLLAARSGASIVLTLTRVEPDSIGGTLEFAASGWLGGAPEGPSAPADSVTVTVEFVAPRQAERSPNIVRDNATLPGVPRAVAP